jgi:predicted NBD/HSP70 family sugar kinase
MMRFYGEQRGFYCGIDLHASKMYVCVLDEQGNVVLHRNLRTEPEALKRALAPYRASLREMFGAVVSGTARHVRLPMQKDSTSPIGQSPLPPRLNKGRNLGVQPNRIEELRVTERPKK